VAGVEAIQIGADVTHGLGAGGDVELGARAAQQDSERLTAAMQHADVVFITAGLGGGTGGGASPVVARLAKEQGALVLAFVAMPFGFEGERRQHQALTSLEQLKAQADAVICIPNNKLFKLLGDNASVMDAFRRSDGIVVSGAQAIWQLLSRKGLINLDFAALRATLGSKHCEGLFSHGEGQGQDKAREAVKNLLENPIFDGGDAMARAEGLLVSILGGPDLTLADVQRAVEPLSRTANRAHLIMGAAVDEGFRGRMAITVIVATNIVSKRGLPATLAKTTLPRRAVETFPSRGGLVAAGRAGRATTASTAGSASKQDAVEHRKGSAKAKQETFQLDGISRGRFDKSEPTLYDGEDLDVPTFIRRGVSLKR
jgi:cell division protein FtsZ